MSRSLVVGALLCVLAGCVERERPPPAPTRDAGPVRDTGPPRDTGPTVRRDAGPSGPTLDGVLDDRAWRGAVEARLTRSTDRPGSTLGRLLATIEDDRLYLGVEVTLAEGDALIGYVDAAVGQEGGAAFDALADADQPLDRALSRALDVPPAFAPELGFGTTAMDRGLTGVAGDIGWRQLGDGASFTWLSGAEAGFVCGTDACEASVPLDRLPADAPRSIGVFLRIAGDDGLSNQTLPADVAATPSVVRQWLLISDGDAPAPDAGVEPDAGVAPDAGPPGIVIDGVMGTSEWAAAATVTDDTPPLGGFVGNTLRQLWVRRDEAFLYVAVRGTLTAGNAVLLYVDRDYTGFDGLASPTPLDDTTGGLDSALSKSLFTPAEVRVDFAWGTLGFGRSGELDDGFGWRDIATDPTGFAPIEAPTACGSEVCETRVPLVELGVNPADDLALFARLGAVSSLAMSNQTLPSDAPAAAELITEVLVVGPP